METGNSTHWETEMPRGRPPDSESQQVDESHGSFAEDDEDHGVDTLFARAGGAYLSEESSHGDSDISIPSGDPRKSIIHKRPNLIIDTDSATSLQSSIVFNELNLQEVIGGGGFGQVWRATWRGTPVAVKVLTGSAQNTHIAKAILEEFKAEINLLKGMRHPNICLYMGACVDPPNRAIITELAAHGSVWDALRLPLTPPYIVADGSPQGCWPLRLYLPGQHGAPPSSQGATSRVSAPIPPRGTWPWELVKRVSCGAARGMAYLHSGDPPVLHRDLKSANLLLDESYTTKVCDFGLSRLKAQARSMTGNCGTVQWMAPEILANRHYDEKADVYSFGIIVWELLSRECPYEGMTAIQCALAVLNRDKRPEIPKWCPPGVHALIKSCVKKEPSERPSFAQIILALDAME
jgi:serine/threonine protein kinase